MSGRKFENYVIDQVCGVIRWHVDDYQDRKEASESDDSDNGDDDDDDDDDNDDENQSDSENESENENEMDDEMDKNKEKSKKRKKKSKNKKKKKKNKNKKKQNKKEKNKKKEKKIWKDALVSEESTYDNTLIVNVICALSDINIDCKTSLQFITKIFNMLNHQINGNGSMNNILRQNNIDSKVIDRQIISKDKCKHIFKIIRTLPSIIHHLLLFAKKQKPSSNGKIQSSKDTKKIVQYILKQIFYLFYVFDRNLVFTIEENNGNNDDRDSSVASDGNNIDIAMGNGFNNNNNKEKNENINKKENKNKNKNKKNSNNHVEPPLSQKRMHIPIDMNNILSQIVDESNGDNDDGNGNNGDNNNNDRVFDNGKNDDIMDDLTFFNQQRESLWKIQNSIIYNFRNCCVRDPVM